MKRLALTLLSGLVATAVLVPTEASARPGWRGGPGFYGARMARPWFAPRAGWGDAPRARPAGRSGRRVTHSNPGSAAELRYACAGGPPLPPRLRREGPRARVGSLHDLFTPGELADAG